MQLVGLLDPELRREGSGRTMMKKVSQARSAMSLESSGWKKDQILEAYLNLVPLRGEIIGIDALSRAIFGKAPQGLDMRESALAAVLVRSPNATPKKIASRACATLRAMHEANGDNQIDTNEANANVVRDWADCTTLGLYVIAVLGHRAFDPTQGIAVHFARAALREAKSKNIDLNKLPGGQLRTSLSAPLQRAATESLMRHLRELRSRRVEDGAIVVLDNASGDVLAWVGSSGQLSRAGLVDGVLAQRQPGSTLKPLLYAQAISQRRLTAASLLDDSPSQINAGSGLYIPQDYDRDFKGVISVRTALAASLNVPAVRTLVMVTPEAFANQLRASGVSLTQNGDYYGYSLALGSADTTLLTLTNSYRTMANGGRIGEIHTLPGAATPLRSVLDERAAFIIGDILADSNARAITFGQDSVLRTPFWSAVKTGTSKDMRDNWAIGWSQRYTVGVWVGNANGAPMWDVSGVSGAAPIWADVMKFLHSDVPSKEPTPPAGVVREHITFGNHLEADRDEWFIAGTQQSVFDTDPAQQQAIQRILTPTDGTIIALDPDIPPANQRLRLESQGRAAAWRMDGKELSRSKRVLWPPWPGKHVLQLVDSRGQVLDQVNIEVRGATVKTPAQQRERTSRL
jgi:penicillin-binding protein 1C